MLKVQPTSFNQVSFQRNNASDIERKLQRTQDLMDDFSENGLKSEKVQEAVTNVATSEKTPKLLKFFLYAAATSVVAFFGGKILASKGIKIIDNPKLGWMDKIGEKADDVLKELPNKKIFAASEEGKKGVGAVMKNWLNKTATNLSNFSQKALSDEKITKFQKESIISLSAEMQDALKKDGSEGVANIIKKHLPNMSEEKLQQIQRLLSSNNEKAVNKTINISVKNMVKELTEKEKAKGAVTRIAGNVAGTTSAVITGAKTIASGDKDNDGALDSEEMKGSMIAKALKLLGDSDGVLDNFLS